MVSKLRWLYYYIGNYDLLNFKNLIFVLLIALTDVVLLLADLNDV